MHAAYYNENDPFAAAWLRELIDEGLICPGQVDERSIEEIDSKDLYDFTQCHFFAGIGVWSYALRNAGWSDNTPVWTGSCPCQSFSQSGKRGGFSDKRHLWPAWFRLIGECRPDVIFGEQVASKDGLAWLDVVSADLEGEGYAVGAADLCAAGLGAPHIRQRLYFVADADSKRRSKHARIWQRPEHYSETSRNGEAGRMAHPERTRWRGRGPGKASIKSKTLKRPERLRAARILGNSQSKRCSDEFSRREGSQEQTESSSKLGNSLGNRRRECGNHDGENERIISPATGFTNGFWKAAEWIYCRDEKLRPVEPGTFPLAHGAAARMGRLRGYGNALCALVAQAFIEAWRELRR